MTTVTIPEPVHNGGELPVEDAPKKVIELVFCMDATGSMGQYIRAAKKAIQAITQALADQNVETRFGLVSYRDHPPQDASYVTKTFPWTNDPKRRNRA